MVKQSQIVYTNQLLLTQLEQITRLGIFDENKIKSTVKKLITLMSKSVNNFAI